MRPILTFSKGIVVGPELSRQLKERYGSESVASEGIEYPAIAETNFLPGGGDPVGITELKRLIQSAINKCPQSKLVVAGYSQGAAITHRALENLTSCEEERIIAAITFGDTRFTFSQTSSALRRH